MIQTGSRVMRKIDYKQEVPAFGIVEHVDGARARVRWPENGRQQHSSLSLISLREITQEDEDRIRAAHRARIKAREEAADRERIYLCTNVNPHARSSSGGHRRPLPLMPSQVVNGKCFYCGATVMLRNQEEVQK